MVQSHSNLRRPRELQLPHLYHAKGVQLMYKVIIADDSSIVRAGLQILLDSCGAYAVTGVATNGNEAIEQSLSLVPDLLLTDLKMPGIPIIEGAKSLKHIYPQMKIIILTAFDESEDIYRAFQAGVDGYLMKDT